MSVVLISLFQMDGIRIERGKIVSVCKYICLSICLYVCISIQFIRPVLIKFLCGKKVGNGCICLYLSYETTSSSCIYNILSSYSCSHSFTSFFPSATLRPIFFSYFLFLLYYLSILLDFSPISLSLRERGRRVKRGERVCDGGGKGSSLYS